MRRLAWVLLLVLACGDGGPPTRPVTFHVNGERAVIHAEIADSDAERQRGLMGRTELARDRGMLFVWPDEDERSFYMFRTLIPLDIIGIRAGTVTAVERMTPCPHPQPERCPETSIGFTDAALEVAAGVAAELGIRVGTRVDLPV